MKRRIDAVLIAFLHDPLLPGRRVPPPGRFTKKCVDRPALSVVDQRLQESCRCHPFHDRARDRAAVVECASIASHVQHHLEHPGWTAASAVQPRVGHRSHGVGVLLSQGGPATGFLAPSSGSHYCLAVGRGEASQGPNLAVAHDAWQTRRRTPAGHVRGRVVRSTTKPEAERNGERRGVGIDRSDSRRNAMSRNAMSDRPEAGQEPRAWHRTTRPRTRQLDWPRRSSVVRVRRPHRRHRVN